MIGFCKKKEPPKKLQVLTLKVCCEGADIDNLNKKWAGFTDEEKNSAMTTTDSEGSLPY